MLGATVADGARHLRTTSLIARIETEDGNAVCVDADADVDVSEADGHHQMIQTAVDSFGRLDVIVNNAGIETRTGIHDMTEEDFEKVMAVNLKSALRAPSSRRSSSSRRRPQDSS